MKPNPIRIRQTELSSLATSSSEVPNLSEQDSRDSSWSSQLGLCCGVMQESMKDAGVAGVYCCVGFVAISLVIGLSVGLTWADNKLDDMCSSNKVINKSGSTMYFDHTFGTVYDGWSFHVDIPKNTTEAYPFDWYNDYYQKEKCVLKVRPKNSGKPDVEVTDCSSTPNAFDSGVCQWTIKDKINRRLRGLPEGERYTDSVPFSQQFSFFSPKTEGVATDYLENAVSNKM
jgi:hypothetical protein